MFDKDIFDSIRKGIKFIEWYLSVKALFSFAIIVCIVVFAYKLILEPIKVTSEAKSKFPVDKIEQKVILDKFLKVRNIENAFDKGLGGIFVPDNNKLKYSYVGSHQVKDSLGRVQTPNNCYDGEYTSTINGIVNLIGNTRYYKDMNEEDKNEYISISLPNFRNSIVFFGYSITNHYNGSYYCPDTLAQNLSKIDNEKITFYALKIPKSKLKEVLFNVESLKDKYSLFDTSFNKDDLKQYIYYHNETGTIVDTTNNGINIYSKEYIDDIFNYAVEYWGSPAIAASNKNTIYYKDADWLTKEEKEKAKYFYEKWIFERNGVKI